MRRLCLLLSFSTFFIGAAWSSEQDQAPGQKKLDEKKAKEPATLEELRAQLEAAKLEREVLQAENARLKQKIAALADALKKNEQDKLDLLKQASKSRADLSELMQLLHKQSKEMAQFLNRKANEPADPNPPAPRVKGKVTKVAQDKQQAGFATVSVGAVHGVKKHDELEVYRLEPRPEYIGKMRIIQVQEQESLGKLLPVGKKSVPSELKVGDSVVDRLD